MKKLFTGITVLLLAAGFGMGIGYFWNGYPYPGGFLSLWPFFAIVGVMFAMVLPLVIWDESPRKK